LDAPVAAFEEIVLRQPSFSTGLASLLTEEHIPAWRDWLCWRVIHSAAGYLSEAFVQEDFDFYGRTLTGTPQLRERWKRGVSLVEEAMGEAVGRAYVERHFPSRAKERVNVLVAYLIEAYRQSIEELEWMGADTRRRALEKLEKFTPKIGYPVRWRDSSLSIDPANLMANARAAHSFELRRQLNKIGKPIDRDEWFMTPQTVNAYNSPGKNEIVFPAAILQYPFFDPDRDDAANYGAIGGIIGHEIGHGFDDQGSKYDGDGRLTDWWSAADRQAFEARTRSLIEQYNALAPRQAPDQHVNGALTIGENIGDLGGLGIAWKAYLVSLHGQEAPVIDGLTGAQRFFLSWARTGQYKVRDQELIRLLATDPHSPNEFRVNQVVRNLDEFYSAFSVGATDELWLEPEARVRIWQPPPRCQTASGLARVSVLRWTLPGMARFEDQDLTDAEFRECDLTRARLIGVVMQDAVIDGLVSNLVVNGDEVASYVEAGLDRRHPWSTANARARRTARRARPAPRPGSGSPLDPGPVPPGLGRTRAPSRSR